MFKIIAIELLEPEQALNDILEKKVGERTIDEQRRVDRYRSIVRVLKREQPFYFYQGYMIKDGKVVEYPTNSLGDDFYSSSIENPLMPAISISAIVGENGMGKSSLIELFMRVLNNVSFVCRAALDWEYAKHLVYINGVYARVYVESQSRIYIIENNGKGGCIRYQELKNGIIDETISKLFEWENGGTQIQKVSNADAKYILSQLFYSIIVNYSAYALSTEDYRVEWATDEELKHQHSEKREDGNGCWFDELFHKNDGYQTPIVLNPYRYNGVIDYNKEKTLLMERLYGIIFDEKNPVSRILNGKDICAIHFDEINIDYIPQEGTRFGSKRVKRELKNYYDRKEVDVEEFEMVGHNVISAWERVWGINLSIIDEQDNNKIAKQAALNYVVAKTIKISLSYAKYRGTVNFDLQDSVLTYVANLIDDTTHVTQKLRRALMFLIQPEYLCNETKTLEEYRLHIKSRLANWNKSLEAERHRRPSYQYKEDFMLYPLQNISVKGEDFWPMPAFVVSIVLENENKSLSKEDIPYALLSSGEKHLISIVAIVLYHVHNIQSRWSQYSSSQIVEEITYRNICIIFDEAELYAHPKYQTLLIDYLLNSLAGLQYGYKQTKDKDRQKSIEGIQIIFATHSPFILSDIPHCNLLCLEDGKPQYNKLQKTFGANIYDLLNNQFFMDSFVGTFALNKIKEIADKINQHQVIDQVTLKEIEEQIDLIAEDWVATELKNRLNTLENEDTLQALKKRLEKELAEVNYKIANKE